MDIKLKSLKEVLQDEEDRRILEMSISGWGDWEPKRDRIYQKSLKQLKSEWEFIDSFDIKDLKLEMFKMKSKDTFILGIRKDEFFDTVLHIELTEHKSISRSFGYKKVMNVDGVMVKDTMREMDYQNLFINI